MEPAIDIYANLTLILNNIKTRNYANEHEFQSHLYKTFQAVHDGHFRFSPDLLSKALLFRRSVEIVSVSRDGLEVPKVYTKGKQLVQLFDFQTITSQRTSLRTTVAIGLLPP